MTELVTRAIAWVVAKLYGYKYRNTWSVFHPRGAVFLEVLHTRRPPFGFGGITFGKYLVTNVDYYATCFAMHETTHTWQWRKWGLLFLLLYPLASLKALLSGGNPYYDNDFEREARHYEDECVNDTRRRLQQ